jgi:hypothetical protein
MPKPETIPSVPVVAKLVEDYLRDRQLSIPCTVAELRVKVHHQWAFPSADAKVSLDLTFYDALGVLVDNGRVLRSLRTMPEAELQELGRDFGKPPGRELLLQSGQARQVHVFQIAPVPITPGQQLVWEALKGRALTAKELVNVLEDEKGTFKSEEVIRQHVAGLREAGHVVEHQSGVGYYRPDAPPSDLQDE